MPDWSYRTISGPMMRRLSHDRGRRFVNGFFSILGRIPEGHRVVDFLGHMAADTSLSVELPSGQKVASQLALMPCIDPRGRGAAAFSRFGAGTLVFGPVCEGNADPLSFSQGSDESIIGTGGAALTVDEASHIVDRTGSSKFFFEIDVFANGDPVAAVKHIVDRLGKRAAGFVLTPQRHHELMELDEADRETLIRELVKCCAAHAATPFVGLPLDLDEADASACAGAFAAGGLAIYLSGASHPDGWKWGGREQQQAALTLLACVREAGARFVLVDAGVTSPRGADALRRAGADLIGIGPGLVHGGPGLPKRINEAFLYFQGQERDAPPPLVDFERAVRRPWAWGALLGFSMLFGAVLAGWSALTTVLLPYDEEFLGRTAADIAAFNPRVLKFMTHDRITLAGTMVSIGILYVTLSWFAIRRGHGWAQHAVSLSAGLGFLSFFAFLGFGYLDPFHAFVTTVLLQFLIQLIVRPIGPRAPPTTCPRLDNDAIWKAGLWGQLLFVVHAGALILAGLTILTFGMTVVFVPQDVAYLGCDAMGIHAFDERLQSLIAHDRATFGGMLLSAGMALLVTTMWSFRHGDRWLLITYFFVIFCPYAMTLWIHWDIGYRDHFHLTPVYIGLGLLAASMLLSTRYLASRDQPNA